MLVNIIRGVLLLWCASTLCNSEDTLKVIWQQVILPSLNDVVLKFRIHVKNVGTMHIQDLQLRAYSCCFFDNVERNCQKFHPVGEKIQYLRPDVEYNLTMLYGNYYIMGRYGDCNGTITHGKNYSQIVRFGTFNTTIPGSYQWLPESIQQWLTGLSRCATVDQDVLRDCEPVNCVYKYDGLKNYFDHGYQLCMETSKCPSEPQNQLPMKGLDTERNKCKDLRLNLTQEDLLYLSKQNDSSLYAGYDIRGIKEISCVHGRLRPNNQSCQCDYGWSSDPHDHSPYDPITRVYYLCNTQTLSSKTKLKKVTTGLIKLVILLIALVIVACAVSFMCFCIASLWMMYKGKHSGQRQGFVEWLGQKFHRDEDRRPLFGSRVHNQSNNATVQHIETSWYSTEDTIHDIAVVHTKSKGKKKGELQLKTGDVITDLEKTNIPGYWKGTCKDNRGIFPINCAEFRRHGQPSANLPTFMGQ